MHLQFRVLEKTKFEKRLAGLAVESYAKENGSILVNHGLLPLKRYDWIALHG